MATYSSYKQITANEIVDGSLTDASFEAAAAKNFGLNGYMEVLVSVHLAAAAYGLFLHT